MRSDPFRIEPPYSPEFLIEAQQAIAEFLLALPPDCRRIFEYGSGCSTPWFATFGSELISIEHDETWHTEVMRVLNAEHLTADVRLCSNVRQIDRMIDGQGMFDLILVDCEDMERLRCVKRAIEHVKPGGALVVDDSHWPLFRSVPKFLDGWEARVMRTQAHIRKNGDVAPHETSMFIRPNTRAERMKDEGVTEQDIADTRPESINEAQRQ